MSVDFNNLESCRRYIEHLENANRELVKITAKDILAALKMQQWTKEPPTVAGYYWCHKKYTSSGKTALFICEIDDLDTDIGETSIVRAVGEDEHFELAFIAKDAQWLGPIQKPEPPKE